MDFQMCDRAHLMHGGQAGLVTEHHKLSEEVNTGPWGCRAVSVPGPFSTGGRQPASHGCQGLQEDNTGSGGNASAL